MSLHQNNRDIFIKNIQAPKIEHSEHIAKKSPTIALICMEISINLQLVDKGV